MVAAAGAWAAHEPEARGDGPLVHLRARRERVVFHVLHHGEVEGARVLERAAHHGGVVAG